MRRWLRLGRARLRQMRADLLASFWLRPAAMTVAAALLAEALVHAESEVELPSAVSKWLYAGGRDGARDVLGAIATASIGVAGTTFSITVAALTLASNQMGPRLLRNFARDPGNQYALGTFLATFAFALLALRTVRGNETEGEFVPQLAVGVALLLALCCVGVLMWFLHHIATSINVTQVIALVHRDLSGAVARLPKRTRGKVPEAAFPPGAFAAAAPLAGEDAGYLRVLDDAGLARWAAEHGARLRLRIRPGDFVFPRAVLGEVAPASLRGEAEKALAGAMKLGTSRSVEQDLEFAVRQLVEVALRALSSGINDPFTVIAVLDRFGAALCELAAHDLPDGCASARGSLRLQRPATDYAGFLDAMFHMVRESGANSPPVMIRLLEVLSEAAAVETDPVRRAALARHAALAAEAALAAVGDRAAREDIRARHEHFLAVLEGGLRARQPDRV